MMTNKELENKIVELERRLLQLEKKDPNYGKTLALVSEVSAAEVGSELVWNKGASYVV
jgi:hypothetical protein